MSNPSKPNKLRSLADRIGPDTALSSPQRQPLWKGPEEDGVTFSLLSRFIQCRERFRVRVVDGLKPVPQFNHRIEYGQMWHVCEEAIRTGDSEGSLDWRQQVLGYCKALAKDYPIQSEQISHWYDVITTQFPIYRDHWAKHPDMSGLKNIFREQVFCISYRLPSGRFVKIRGKLDSADLVTSGKNRGVWVQENKTKGDIKEDLIAKQLTGDLQTMLYVLAAKDLICLGVPSPPLFRGVRYNVVRRPLSGGKHSIVRYKPSKSNPHGEARGDFYNRLGGLIRDNSDYFFIRWNVEITDQDIERFKTRTLNPLLEQLCDWWQWICSDQGASDPFSVGGGRGLHWIHPYGVYNALDEGGCTDLDDYINTGSRIGLVEADSLFSELDGPTL